MKNTVLQGAAHAIEAARRLALHSDRVSALLHTEAAQPFLEQAGRLRARAVRAKAETCCPAWRAFCAQEGWAAPVTTKDNYVRMYEITARCYNGKLPARGVIDESSGSSGTPNQWVRGPHDRGDIKAVLQSHFRQTFGNDSDRILLNCFALGPWATRLNVTSSLADVGVMKSIGPDAAKLESTLRTFGPTYRYIVFGYPPFLKDFFDKTALDLTAYHLDLVVGGEGMSEAVRDGLLRMCRSVVSSYGASDLDINIGLETPFTIALRRVCAHDAALCYALFGRDRPPMIFQYNPLDYVIESLPGGELAFTVTRFGSAAPKIRYNLHDLGGVCKYRDLMTYLAAKGICPDDLARPRSALPFLYVWGRSDLSVAFYGAKVFPSDIEEVIAGDPTLARAVRSFQIKRDDGEQARLHIALEAEPEHLPAAPLLRDAFFAGLCRVNQDFREVSRMFNAQSLEVAVYAEQTGPFANRDIRIKNRYVADDSVMRG